MTFGLLLATQACAKSTGNIYIDENLMPQVNVGSGVVRAKINNQLSSFFKDFSCKDGSMPDITIENTFVNDSHLSASYMLAGYCPGLASPFEFSGGFTFDLISGELVPLEKLVDNRSLIDNAIQKAYHDRNKGGCSLPDYSGEFYLKEGAIILKEFYPSKQDITCEFEVQLSISR
jgi:hypothetical protein